MRRSCIVIYHLSTMGGAFQTQITSAIRYFLKRPEGVFSPGEAQAARPPASTRGSPPPRAAASRSRCAEVKPRGELGCFRRVSAADEAPWRWECGCRRLWALPDARRRRAHGRGSGERLAVVQVVAGCFGDVGREPRTVPGRGGGCACCSRGGFPSTMEPRIAGSVSMSADPRESPLARGPGSSLLELRLNFLRSRFTHRQACRSPSAP